MSIVFAILLFSILIFVHEFGHFIAAKLSDVQVNEFSMFMGPAIFKKQVGETLYSIRCVPIGGYCAMEGEDEDTDNPRSFQKAAWWKRLIILLAGAFMNFITGLLIFLICYAPMQQYAVPVIDYFEEGCVLQAEDGLQPGDRILKVDGDRVFTASDFSTILSLNPGDIHDLVVERNGEKVILDDFNMVKAEFPDPNGGTSVRYGFNFSLEDATFGRKIAYVWNVAMSNVQLVKLSVEMLISGQAGIQDMGGPVMIVDQMNQVAAASPTAFDAFLNMLYFGGFIAINLAVMNLLPIPALDGGRAVCLLITAAVEGITRKKINPKYEGYLHGAGMILLLGLMAVIMFKDIFVIIKR
ncbi:MAG: site-2 protease family protein [Oscillospiraceae bacterium]|nr:site-2 protease family protein [Oscillospiraceae bacterium]